MYFNTVTNFKRGIVTLPLPLPVTFNITKGKVVEKEDILPDTHLLTLPMEHDFPSLEEISLLSDRVGGVLGGKKVELGIRDIKVEGDSLLIPFLFLEGVVEGKKEELLVEIV